MNELIACCGIKKGVLPGKYLGVSFSSRLCARSVDGITSGFKGWTVKRQSFAGRVQLIKSVILSLTNYWCRLFLLPMKVIKLVEQKCRDHGRVDLWDLACILRCLWRILWRSGCLWVAWVCCYPLRKGSIWSVSSPTDATYAWRKLMEVRHILKPHINDPSGKVG